MCPGRGSRAGNHSGSRGSLSPRHAGSSKEVPVADKPALLPYHPGGNPGANLKSISHRCHPILVAFVWELTEETIDLPLGCLQCGS